MDVRPLQERDIAAAARMVFSALGPPSGFGETSGLDWLERRTAHLHRSDPGGAWVADLDGEIVGLALASLRDGDIWGLSMLAVHPDPQARGTGKALLNATLEYGANARAGIILSSTDPRAMRLYARAGFDLHPTVSLSGILDRSAIPSGLKARPTDDLEAACELARPVRGGAYDVRDVELQLTRPDSGVFWIPGRGFVLHAGGHPVVLVADSDGVATDLLWTALAETPRGGTVSVDMLMGGHDWAVRACLAAGLAITPEGPVYTRGVVGTLRPWIPSGAML